MKRTLVCLGALLMAGFVYAAVTQFTETLPPAATAGSVPTSNGYSWSLSTNPGNNINPPLALPSYTLAFATSTLITSTTGQLVVIVSGAGVNPTLCVSSGTTAVNQIVNISTGGVGTLAACH